MSTMSRTAVCPVCEAYIRIKADGIFVGHTAPTGLPEDTPFAYRECEGSGASPAEALRIVRTFYDSGSSDILLEVADGGDEVTFESLAQVSGGQSFKINVGIRGSDVRKLIARLTEIADARGF